MMLSKRRAHSRDHVWETCLPWPEYVHVPFDNNRDAALTDGRAGVIEPKEGSPLIEQIRLGELRYFGSSPCNPRPPIAMYSPRSLAIGIITRPRNRSYASRPLSPSTSRPDATMSRSS